MTLRDQMAQDVVELFLKLDEFAETHLLDGVPCLMVVDNDRLERWKTVNLAGGIGLPENALADVQVYLYLSEADFPAPMPGQVVRYDNRPLRVVSVVSSGGMLELVLGGLTHG